MNCFPSANTFEEDKMGLIIHKEKIDAEAAKKLCEICPFGAITWDGDKLSINSACKMCKMCVRKGPEGAITFEEDKPSLSCNKDEWRGVLVFAEANGGKLHPVSLELLGKAKELAAVTGHPVYALLIGSKLSDAANELLKYGADKVFVYDDERLAEFVITPYANAFSDMIQKVKPSSILVGATLLGRSLAPKVAARVHTGLTADCTVLEMKENTDLVQIRPAFGGNIMAQIVTPRTRPQFCTVRYKIFSAPEKAEPHGVIEQMKMDEKMYLGATEVFEVIHQKGEADISDAETIVAVGRGVRSQDDLKMIEELADLIGAKMACTRPLIECGWFDAKKQIGLSGRTVKPKLIITLGISGSVQFAAGMRSSDMIIAINSDPNAPIFDIAHHGFVGNLYDIVPELVSKIKEARNVQ